MTESIKGVSGSHGVSSGSSHNSSGPAGDHKKRDPKPPQRDLVEISKDAMDRSTGKVKKNILEYLKDLLR